MLRDVYIGDDKVARIYTGEDVVHPSPVREGLVLWYDFMGRKNSDAQRGIAEDLSGNGNDGTLVNFAYTEGSGYEEGLEFDGVDDFVETYSNNSLGIDSAGSLEVLVNVKEVKRQALIRQGSFSQNLELSLATDGALYFEILNLGVRTSLAYRFPTELLNKIILLQCIVNSEGLRLFLNGSRVQNINRAIAGIEKGTGSVRLSVMETRGFLGNMYSTRIYNRALTPEEIQHNYQMEKERWNL